MGLRADAGHPEEGAVLPVYLPQQTRARRHAGWVMLEKYRAAWKPARLQWNAPHPMSRPVSQPIHDYNKRTAINFDAVAFN